ncbi:argonaute family [Rhizoctonia solani]|uniref:Argonaute family n=1 Tax=Rhizoctonia solani TaxID=456999 RepID=A0A8H7LGA8_9AGAM|nr:argonaute family [Rhizoctonia solani]
MESIGETELPALRNQTRDAPPYVPDPTPATKSVACSLSPGVATMGAPRPIQPGTRGIEFTVTTNHFAVTLADILIHHYHVIENSDLEPRPARWNLELLQTLQEKIVPTVFTPRAVYDGRHNLFASRRLPLRGDEGNSQTVRAIILKKYCNGQVSLQNEVLTAFTPLNIILRMKPRSLNPFNSRCVLTEREMRPLGGGIVCVVSFWLSIAPAYRRLQELWRGYFQSIRPGVRSLFVNVDASSGTMYAPGPMIELFSRVLGSHELLPLIPKEGLSESDRRKLQVFFGGVRFVTVNPNNQERGRRSPKVLRNISAQGADSIQFTDREGHRTTVSEYFASLGITLRYPRFICLETVDGAVYPIELCFVTPGQIFRRCLPADQAPAGIPFSQKTPRARLDSIAAGHNILSYDTSEYMQSFQMAIEPNPQTCLARKLEAPLLDYGMNQTHRPENGKWNFKGCKVYEPAKVLGWAMLVYDSYNWTMSIARNVAHCLVSQAAQMGWQAYSLAFEHVHFGMLNYDISVRHLDVAQHLRTAGHSVIKQYQIQAPTLFVVVLPRFSSDLYQAVKHFGDITMGVATQCLKGERARSPCPQYLANVCLKINAKLGGVNSKLNASDNLAWTLDSANSLMIIASYVVHPPPGAHGLPSFSGVVGSLDLGLVVEMINGLEDTVYELIGRHFWWKNNREARAQPFPERITYYRAGITDNEVAQLLSIELPAIQGVYPKGNSPMISTKDASAACKRHNIQTKVTVVLVGKQHHTRFFPTHGMVDSTGNCPAGTVVDSM